VTVAKRKPKARRRRSARLDPPTWRTSLLHFGWLIVTATLLHVCCLVAMGGE